MPKTLNTHAFLTSLAKAELYERDGRFTLASEQYRNVQEEAILPETKRHYEQLAILNGLRAHDKIHGTARVDGMRTLRNLDGTYEPRTKKDWVRD